MADPDSESAKLGLETDFGQRVAVERTFADQEKVKAAVEELHLAGQILNPMPGTVEYLGAAAVHIYKSPMLDQLFFVSQTPLGALSEPIAAKAIESLRSDCMVAYGRKRSVRRSGF
jgi:hypothetical protein